MPFEDSMVKRKEKGIKDGKMDTKKCERWKHKDAKSSRRGCSYCCLYICVSVGGGVPGGGIGGMVSVPKMLL